MMKKTKRAFLEFLNNDAVLVAEELELLTGMDIDEIERHVESGGYHELQLDTGKTFYREGGEVFEKLFDNNSYDKPLELRRRVDGGRVVIDVVSGKKLTTQLRFIEGDRHVVDFQGTKFKAAGVEFGSAFANTKKRFTFKIDGAKTVMGGSLDALRARADRFIITNLTRYDGLKFIPLEQNFVDFVLGGQDFEYERNKFIVIFWKIVGKGDLTTLTVTGEVELADRFRWYEHNLLENFAFEVARRDLVEALRDGLDPEKWLLKQLPSYLTTVELSVWGGKIEKAYIKTFNEEEI